MHEETENILKSVVNAMGTRIRNVYQYFGSLLYDIISFVLMNVFFFVEYGAPEDSELKEISSALKNNLIGILLNSEITRKS